MKLLFDENLSPKLAKAFQDLFPGSSHVDECGLGAASDADIWRFAEQNDYVIVSKDSDFYDRSALYGGPPKVVWLRVGNCTTDDVAALLKGSVASLAALATSPDTTLIILRWSTRT